LENRFAGKGIMQGVWTALAIVIAHQNVIVIGILEGDYPSKSARRVKLAFALNEKDR
jgi:hypothetical protein